jgi:hypothetical protein
MKEQSESSGKVFSGGDNSGFKKNKIPPIMLNKNQLFSRQKRMLSMES